MKTEIYNLIILDESGSMDGIREQTISGCNETLNTIRSAQDQFSETQTHYLSIYAFQSGRPSRYIIKNQPIGEAKNIGPADYEPWGGTPLYDAVGGTVAELKALTASKELAIGSVTIITDGYENSSEQYTQEKVANMISALKEQGWNFSFIGANIDAASAAISINITNSLQFTQSVAGTKAMFERERRGRMSYYNRAHDAMSCAVPGSANEAKSRLKDASENYFEEEKPSETRGGNKK